MNALNGFDTLAPIYDRLASLVFGSTLKKAQREYLGELSNAQSILIVGGGTGWLLCEVLAVSNASVVYVEASQRMIEKSRRSIPPASLHRVTFVHDHAEKYQSETSVDVVIANFFLDMYDTSSMNHILAAFRSVLIPSGKLLCTDFVDGGPGHRLMLRLMYIFFRLTTGLSNQHLAPWRDIIVQNGFERLREATFRRGFVVSGLYRKKPVGKRLMTNG